MFEAGAGATRSSWALVQPLVAAFAHAVVYDRSGMGRSAPDPVSRTMQRMADDLDEVAAIGELRDGVEGPQTFELRGKHGVASRLEHG